MKKKVFLKCVEELQNRISELKRALDKQLETILAQRARIRELEAKGAPKHGYKSGPKSGQNDR